MAPTLPANARPSRTSTWEEIGAELRRKWGRSGGAPGVFIVRPGAMPGRRIAFLVVFPPGEQYRDGITENHLTGDAAELEWWQKDHRLLGFGLARTTGEAVAQAIACADRGTVERLGLEVWFDRGPRRFRFFARSRRDSRTYRPSGRELTAEQFRILVGN
jgi:hypothetical protein